MDWDKSKENIQPLRGGRKAANINLNVSNPSVMGLGIPNEQSKAIRDQESAFEEELRTSSDLDDALDPWYRYVLWTEQTYPKGGQHLKNLLQKCIAEFKDNEKFKQDPRYCEIWMKCASLSNKSIQYYEFMYEKNLCTDLPELYINWAWELEQAEHFEKAKKVFAKGVNLVKSEEHKNSITRKQELFEARFMKHVFEKKPEENQDEEQRSVLGALKGQGKKQKVGSLRVGNAKLAQGPGVYVDPKVSSSAGNLSKSTFNIYEDGHVNQDLPMPSSKGPIVKENLPFHEGRNQENETAAQKWTSARIGKKSQAVALDQISSKPKFEIHKDEGLQQPAKTTEKVNFCLGLKKVDGDIPLALFEPPDPTKRAMYCKHLVYQGNTEYSFEELRAIKVRKHLEEKAMERKYMEIRRMTNEMEAKQQALELEQRKLNEQQEQFRQMQEKMFEEQKKKIELMQQEVLANQEEKLRLIQEEILQKNENQDNNKDKSDVIGKKGSFLDDTTTLLQGTSNPASLSTKELESSIESNNRPNIAQPSPTVNTKEAFNLMKEMWYHKDEEKNDESIAPVPQEKHQFQIYCDNEPTKENQVQESHTESPERISLLRGRTLKQKKPFQIFMDKENIASKENELPRNLFTGDNDGYDTEEVPSDKKMQEPKGLKLKIYSDDDDQNMEKSNEIPLTTPPRNDSDKENLAPEGYMDKAENQPDKVRDIAGILQPSKDIPVIPRDNEEMLEEETSSFEKMPPPDTLSMHVNSNKDQKSSTLPRKNPNATIFLPSKETFEAMAVVASTPFHGRRFFLDEEDEALDDNTSAVHIIRKASKLEETSKAATPAAAAVAIENNLLTPIMETSREHNYKSSSSSGQSTYNHQLTKSHWGNTHLGQTTMPHPDGKTPASVYMKSNVKPIEVTSLSGYMADSSSSRSLGLGLKADLPKKTHELIATPNANEKKQKLGHDFAKSIDEDEEVDMTGVIGDMMKDFKNEAKKYQSPGNCFKSSYLQESLKDDISYLDTSKKMPFSNKGQFSKLSFADFSQLYSPNPKIQSSFIPTMDEMRSPILDESTVAPLENLTLPRMEENQVPEHIDDEESAPSPNQDLSIHMSALGIQGFGNISDPFNEELKATILKKLNDPIWQRHGYFRIRAKLPQIKSNKSITINENMFSIGDCQGEGAYGKVYKAVKQVFDVTMCMNETISNMDVVLKVQKPACEWDFYICTEVHKRLSPESPHHALFMSIPRCFTYDDGSIFVSEYQQGTLLDLINRDLKKITKLQYESVAIYFVIEMLTIAENLQKIGIIHGDIKPDNLLIQNTPRLNLNLENPLNHMKPSLQLIDFGRSIDMTMFPHNTSFNFVFSKDDLKTSDMIDNKPWTYQLDYFCIASVTFTLLSGSYMQLTKKDEKHFPSGQFKRWWNQELWNEFFNEFLNIPSCNELPDLSAWKRRFQEIFLRDKAKNFNDIVRQMFDSR